MLFFIFITLLPFCLPLTFMLSFHLYCSFYCDEITTSSASSMSFSSTAYSFSNFPSSPLEVEAGSTVSFRLYSATLLNMFLPQGISGYIRLNNKGISTNAAKLSFWNSNGLFSGNSSTQSDGTATYDFYKTSCRRDCYVSFTIPSSEDKLDELADIVLPQEYQCMSKSLVISKNTEETIELDSLVSSNYTLGRYVLQYNSIKGTLANNYQSKTLISDSSIKYTSPVNPNIDVLVFYVPIGTDPNTQNCAPSMLLLKVCNDNCTDCNVDNMCVECLTGYAFISDTSTCLSDDYFLDNFYCAIDTEGKKRCYPCYSSCLHCDSLGDGTNNKCSECKSDYFSIENADGTFNCYEHCSDGNYLQIENTKKCTSSCASTSTTIYTSYDETTCLTICDIDHMYILEGNKCTSSCNDDYPYDYYDIFHYCYRDCNEKGTAFIKDTLFCDNLDCTLTKYAKRTINGKKFCTDECDSGYFVPATETSSAECVSQCNGYIMPNNLYCLDACKAPYKYYNDINNTCTSQCEASAPYNDTFHCLVSCDMSTNGNIYTVKSNKQCVDMCPQGTEVNEDNECVTIDTVLPANNTTTQTKEEMLSMLNTSVVELLDVNSTIKGDDYYLQVYPSDTPITDNSVSSIDLGECEGKLREVYGISKDESLIIAKMDYVNKSSIANQVEYQVYDQSGNLLDLTPCKDIPISIEYPINTDMDINLTQASAYSDEGIDVFDKEDSFFNDICYPYQIDGIDIPLSERRNQLYQNFSLCEDDCKYEGVNFTTNKAICSCNVKTSLSTETNTTSNTKNDFVNQIFSVNIDVMKCYELIPKWDNIHYNIGFWTLGAITMLTIVINIWCMRTVMLHIKSKMYRFTHNPSEKSTTMEMMISQNSLNKDGQFFELTKEKMKNIMCVNYNSTNYSIDTKESSNSIAPHEEHLNIVKTKLIEYYPYSLALEKDKRGLFYMFWSYLKMKYLPFRAIFPLSSFEVIQLNLLTVLFSCAITFILNALFYTNDTISTQYNNKGKLSLLVDLVRSVYSALSSILLINILQFLSSYTPILDTIYVEVTDKERLLNLSKNALRIVKRNIMIFYVIDIALIVIFWYYVVTFCIVYSSYQMNWFTGSMLSFCISLIVSVVMSWGLAVMRYIGLRCEKEMIYNVSLFINRYY